MSCPALKAFDVSAEAAVPFEALTDSNNCRGPLIINLSCPLTFLSGFLFGEVSYDLPLK